MRVQNSLGWRNRGNKSGEIDLEKSLQIVKQISVASTFYPGLNILIDLRGTRALTTDTESYPMTVIMKVTEHFVELMPNFEDRIACIIPNDQKRISVAERLEACMKIKNIDYKFFTNFEDSIDWLSEVKA